MGADVDVFGDMGEEEGVWPCCIINPIGLGRSREALELYFE